MRRAVAATQVRRIGIIIDLVLLVAGAVVASTALSEPTYSVAQVLAGLHRQPTAFFNRTLQVHGLLDLCPPDGDCVILGSLADEHTPTRRLFILDTVESKVLGTLRRVPLINVLLPPYPPRAQGQIGTYRLAIYGLSAPMCSHDRAAAAAAGQSYCIVLTDTSIP